MADIKLDGLTVASSSGSPTAISLNSAVDIKANLNATGDAPVYACRAWVNFRGTSQSGTLNTSGPVTGLYTATVTGATTFTIEYSSTTYTVTTSGNHEVGDGEGVDLTISGTSVTVDTQIRESGNVSAVVDNGTGEYTVNFEIPMPDANYVLTSSSNDSNSDRGFHVITIDYDESGVGTAPSTTSVKIINRVASSQTFSSTPLDCLNAMVAIFR